MRFRARPLAGRTIPPRVVVDPRVPDELHDTWSEEVVMDKEGKFHGGAVPGVKSFMLVHARVIGIDADQGAR